MQRFVKLYLFSLGMLMFMLGCETRDYELPERPKQVETASTDVVSSVIFEGLTSITDVDDYGATLYWEEVDNVINYKIFDVTDGAMNLLASVDAPADSITLTGLKSGTTYTLKVIAQDSEGKMAYNDSEITISTDVKPSTPSYIIRTNPTSYQTIGAEKNPTLYIYGVRKGDTVKLYSDNCSTEIASGVADNSYIILTSTTDLTPGTYYFYAKVTNPNGVSSNCSSASSAYIYQTCPSGYVEVPASVDIGTPKFCVMAYEAKAWKDNNYDGIVSSTSETDSDGCYETGCTTKNWGISTYKPGSGAYGKPWRMLDAYTAKEECKSLGDNYDLISNMEWMAIARNIEEQASNWSGGTLGVGCVKRGNTGVDDACSYYLGYIESDGGATTNAKHVLSNGASIYHMAGNVAEWIDMAKEDTLTTGPTTCDPEYISIEEADNFCSGQLSFDDYATDNAGSLTFTNYGYVYTVAEDSSGNMYFATDGGIAKSTNNAQSFSNLTALNGLPKNGITGGVATNSTNYIFAGTTLGLAVSTNGGQTFSLKTTSHGLGSNNVNDVFISSSDTIYVATNGGLSISTNGGASFTNYTNASNSLGDDIVLSVYVDGTNIYAGTVAGLSLSTNGGSTFTTKTNADGLISNRIESIYASGTSVYVATNMGFSFSTDSMASFTNKTTSNGLGSNYIWDIAVDSDNNIYLATEVGLAFSEDAGATWTNRTTSHGLAENSVNGIYIDSDDYIYAATDAGLSISKDGAASFVSYDSSNGLGGASTVGLGKIAGGSAGAAMRGGSYQHGAMAGIYGLNFTSFPHQSFADTGFRCVYRP